MAETEIEKEPSVLDDVRAAMAENEGGGGGNTDAVGRGSEAPGPGTVRENGEFAEGAAQRARDEAGRFAKAEIKPRETLSLKPQASADNKASDGTPLVAPSAVPTPDASKPTDEPILPPADWKGAGKVQWNKLPKAVQVELRDTYQGLAASRAEIEPMQAAITPYKDAWVRDAGSVPAAISQLGQFYELFLTNPIGLIQHIARARGINLGSPQGQAPDPGATQQAPDFASLITQAVQQQVAPLREQLQQSAIKPTIDLLVSAKTDPKYPYFNDIEGSLEHFIPLAREHLASTEPGRQHSPAEVLDASYQMATWAHPVIRQQLEQAKAEATKATQAAAVAKARAAGAISVRGSPLPGVNGSGGAGAGASVLDDVRAAAAELSGA